MWVFRMGLGLYEPLVPRILKCLSRLLGNFLTPVRSVGFIFSAFYI
jgi:hypothetical protein